MSITDQELKDEMRADMMQEAKEEEYEEKKLWDDVDYAFDKFVNKDIVDDVILMIDEARENLLKYGHEYSRKDIVEEFI